MAGSHLLNGNMDPNYEPPSASLTREESAMETQCTHPFDKVAWRFAYEVGNSNVHNLYCEKCGKNGRILLPATHGLTPQKAEWY